MSRSSRPDNMTTLGLSLQLLKNIPARGEGGRSAAQLHAMLPSEYRALSLRTVQRHLQHMAEHLPNEVAVNDRSKPYTYSRVSFEPSLNAGRLSEAEAMLLVLAQRELSRLLPKSIGDRLAPLFGHARSVLIGQRDLAQQEAEWLSKIASVPTSQPLMPAVVDDHIFATVSEALFFNRELRLRYRNESAVEKDMDVRPLALTLQGPIMVLVCHSSGYATPITLLLHRILDAEAKTFTFERPTDFDLERFTHDGQFGYGDGKRIRLTFRLPTAEAKHLLETPLARDQVTSAIGDEIEITATVVYSQMLVRWLRGFGRTLKLKQPRFLRSEL
ncbi:helix-turn-helix transcriptional regulator [Niveibacterium sp.]|uniref:helix-turn-helix transcriptional regulator n=1 Tax=Niveibacterium sp. TaxID=2017444 RepID=UPI0035ADEBEF